MILLSGFKLGKSFGANKLFEGVNFELHDTDKVGLVGLNGVGKTTLLKMLTGEETIDSGLVNTSKGVKIGYLEQQPYYPNMTVRAVLLSVYGEIENVRSKMTLLEEQMSNCTDSEKMNELIATYGKACDLFENLGGYSYEIKYNMITSGLGLSEEFCNQQFEELSGGQKTKVLIAKLLLCEPNLLFLDEPTNYLDIESLKWLETYLQEFKGALLIVSHDRYFLDKVVNAIWELTPTAIETYNGNYSNYVVERQNRFDERMKDFADQQKRLNKMEDQIKWMKSTGSNVLKAKAHQIEHKMDKIEKIDKPVLPMRKLKINLSGSRSPKKVIEFSNIAQGYDDILFTGATGSVYAGDSIGIIGKNGVGKTTLIKTILGELEPIEGKTLIGESIRIGYLDQESKFDDQSKTILEEFLLKTSLPNENGRRELAKIGFYSTDVNKRIAMLSGGEKKRLKLAILIQNNPNLLVLDEPTNHLDLMSREQLEEVLIDFAGTMIFVSHDRYFLNKVANKIWELTPTGLEEVLGNYDDYIETTVIGQSSFRRR